MDNERQTLFARLRRGDVPVLELIRVLSILPAGSVLKIQNDMLFAVVGNKPLFLDEIEEGTEPPSTPKET